MELDTSLLTWPTGTGYTTIKPLSTKSPRKVWLLRRDIDQLHVVLKIADAAEQVALARADGSREVQKYVVDVYGTLSTEHGQGVLMEYCPGGSLAHLVQQRSPLSLAECVTALAPIAQTLAAMHANGLRHGDVSAANILLTAQGMPKIIDFQEATGEEQAPVNAGTPGFTAPETGAGTEEFVLGERDVYALGACLWFLLSGAEPDIAAYRTPVQVQFPDMPPIIQDLLVDCLNEDPRQRPGASDFARILFASAAAEPIAWEGYVDPETDHLMQTIHPEASRAAVRKLPRPELPWNNHRRAKDDAGERWKRAHRVRRTPGGPKVLASVALGAVLVAGSYFGLNALSMLQPANGSQQQPDKAPATGECRIKDLSQLPACALSSDTVVGSFLALSDARDEAMNRADLQGLAKIYVLDSEQRARDEQTLHKLDELHLRVEGLHTHMGDIKIEARGEDNSLILSARSQAGAYRYVDEHGATVHRVQAGEPEWIRVQVVLGEDGWLLGDVISRQS